MSSRPIVIGSVPVLAGPQRPVRVGTPDHAAHEAHETHEAHEARRADPGRLSPLWWSATQRLLFAGALVAGLWLVIVWAIV